MPPLQGGRRRIVRWAVCSLLIGVFPHPASGQTAVSCEQAGLDAEKAMGLPAGLLLAIGEVESGRWNSARGRTLPWPWSIDAAGEGRQFETKADVLAAAQSVLDSGQRNLDVGCFQISLLYHPDAFMTLDQAFDPVANAAYAARLLVSLHDQLGNWADAVAAYHSADPARGTPYRQLVFARWLGAGGLPGAPTVVDTGIHIWTPSTDGTAPSVITLPGGVAPGAGRLPRIITPDQ